MTDQNELTEEEQERLATLIEEATKVAQIGCKILRHGYASYHLKKPTEINREALQRELGDLMHAMLRMMRAGDLDYFDWKLEAEALPTVPPLQ